MAVQVPQKKRIYVLDYIKAIAMICVIINHCNFGAQVEKDLLYPYFIGLAVPIFILISGFTFSLSYHKYENLGISHWYKKQTLLPKLSRFVMPFIPIFLLELLYRNVMMAMPADPLLILRSFFFGGYGPGGYYITIVIQLLLVFPFCYVIIKKWDFKGVILLGFVQILYQIFADQIALDDIYYKRIFLRLLIFLAVGIYLYLHRENALGTKRTKVLLLLSFVGGAIYIYFANYLNMAPEIFLAWKRTAMPTVFYIYPVIALVIAGCQYKKIPGKCGNLFALIGRATYHILLIQMFWFHIVKYSGIALPLYIQIPLNLILTVALGIGYFQLDEKIRSILKQKKNSKKNALSV